MKRNGRYHGTWHHLTTHWPRYLLHYLSLLLLLALIGWSAMQGYYGLILLALAAFLLSGYFFAADLWAIHHLYDRDGLQPHHHLFDMAPLTADSSFAFVNVNGRQQALALGQRLRTGRIVVIDIYNPQLAPHPALVRGRARLRHPPDDPRFLWRDGQIGLLPLPDESVTAVFLLQTLSHLWQHGDRETLLHEIRRVLRPGGSLLLTERCRTRANWLTLGPAALSLQPPSYWQSLLRSAGFTIRDETTLDGLIHCLRATRPIPQEGQQLQLNLNL